MIDFGIVSTAVAAIISGLAGAFGTYKTMQNNDQKELDTEQKEWREEMRKEAQDLRDRIDKMQLMIDDLLSKKYEMQAEMAVMSITIKQLRLQSLD